MVVARGRHKAVVATAFAVLAVMGLTVFTPQIASARGGKIQCKGLDLHAVQNGTLIPSQLSQCTGPTGGSGTISGSSISSATIAWANGTTTSWSITLSGPKNGNCKNSNFLGPFVYKGVVTSDTTGSATVHKRVTLTVCEASAAYMVSLGQPGDSWFVGYGLYGPPKRQSLTF